MPQRSGPAHEARRISLGNPSVEISQLFGRQSHHHADRANTGAAHFLLLFRAFDHFMLPKSLRRGGISGSIKSGSVQGARGSNMSSGKKSDRPKRPTGPPIIEPPTIKMTLGEWNSREGDHGNGEKSLLPGMQMRFIDGKPEHFWIANSTAEGRVAKRRGYIPTRVRLVGTADEKKRKCENLQKHMIAWLRQKVAQAPEGSKPKYDGTLGSIVTLYFASEYSGFSKLASHTKTTYLQMRGGWRARNGHELVKKMGREKFFNWHKEIAEDISPGYAAEMMGHLRQIIRFGIDFCTDGSCLRAREILADMRFEGYQPGTTYLTADMAVAFRRSARQMGHPEMALAEAIQFESALRQKDVIGCWTHDVHPADVPRVKGKKRLGNVTWSNGLIWEYHITRDLALVKATSKSNGRKAAMSDLSMCPMVMEELELSGVEIDQMAGPVIIDPHTGLPYKAAKFRKLWREIAKAADIPDYVCNKHSRHGAITEGSEADVDIDHLREFATHSAAKTTQIYNKATLKKSRKVHAARSAHREREMQKLPQISSLKIIEHKR